MIVADILIGKFAKDLAVGLTVVVSKVYLSSSLQLSADQIAQAVGDLEAAGFIRSFRVASPDLLRVQVLRLS